MTATTLQLFTETMEKTAQWLEELTTAIGDSEPRRAYSVLRAVFKLLSHHVTGGEIGQVRDQLPAEVRSLWDVAA